MRCVLQRKTCLSPAEFIPILPRVIPFGRIQIQTIDEVFLLPGKLAYAEVCSKMASLILRAVLVSAAALDASWMDVLLGNPPLGCALGAP